MDTIILNIKRYKSLVGAVMPYHIMLNGKEKAKLDMGNHICLEIPNEETILKVSMVGNALTFHNVGKELVLFPQYCKTNIINCCIITKINWVGVLTFGLFQALGTIEIKIDYC